MRRGLFLAIALICGSADMAVSAELKDGVYVFDPRFSTYTGSYTGTTSFANSDGTSGGDKVGGTYGSGGAKNRQKKQARRYSAGDCLTPILRYFCKIDGDWQPKFASNSVKTTWGGGSRPWPADEVCSLSFSGGSLSLSRSIQANLNEDLPGFCSYRGTANDQYNEQYFQDRAVVQRRYSDSSTGRLLNPPPNVCTISSSRTGSENYNYVLTSAGKPPNSNGTFTYDGELDATKCKLPPFRTVSLNPYWLYPKGTDSVTLTHVAMEINSPGSGPGSLGSGLPVATSVATDGVSRLIIGARTLDGVNPIAFSISPGRGTLKKLRTNLFRDTSGGTETSIEVRKDDFINIPQGGGAKAAAVVFVAPKTPRNFNGASDIDVVVTQANKKLRQKIFLRPAPVLLVHGLWSDGSAWNNFKTNFPGGKFPLVDTITYDGTGSFTLPRNQKLLGDKIRAMLSQVRQQGIVAAQVNTLWAIAWGA